MKKVFVTLGFMNSFYENKEENRYTTALLPLAPGQHGVLNTMQTNGRFEKDPGNEN